MEMFGGSSCDEKSNHPYRGTLSIWKYWAYSDHYQLVNQEIHGGSHFLLQNFWALPFKAPLPRVLLKGHASQHWLQVGTDMTIPWWTEGAVKGAMDASIAKNGEPFGATSWVSQPNWTGWFWKNCHKSWHFIALGSIQSQAKWESEWICGLKPLQ
jgi:hypothetical protein